MHFSCALSIINNTNHRKVLFIRHFRSNRNERGTGAEIRPEIVSGIATGQLLGNVSPEVFA